MGLHQGIKVSKEVPFFIAEVRKNMFSRAFYTDKELGTFLGRPPRISQRYCVCELPLDLTMEELGLEGNELEAALAQLNEFGWNTEDRCQGSSWNRVMLINSLFREEILELSLGPVDAASIEIKAEDILNRQEESWSTLPHHFRNWRAHKNPWVKIAIGYLSLDRLYNDFLLKRTVVRFTKASARDLLETARQMLLVILEQASLRIQPGDFDWMVSRIFYYMTANARIDNTAFGKERKYS